MNIIYVHAANVKINIPGKYTTVVLISIYKIESMFISLNVCISVAVQRPNNGVDFSLGSVLRNRCRGNIFLLIIIIHHLLYVCRYVCLSVCLLVGMLMINFLTP
jgi:hypothetical protein